MSWHQTRIALADLRRMSCPEDITRSGGHSDSLNCTILPLKTFKKPKSTRKEKKYICHKHRRKWSRSNSLPDNGVEVTTSWLCELKEGELPSAPPTPSLHCIQETKAKKSKRKQSAKPASRRRSSMSSPLSSHAVDPLCRDHGDIPVNPYCTEYVRCGTQPALSGYKKVRDLDYPRQFRRTSYCVNQSNSSKASESALTSKRRTSLPALMLGTQRMQSRHQDGLLLAGSASGSRVLRASSPDSQSSDSFYLYRGGSVSTSSDCNTSTGYCSDLDGSSTITSPAGSELPSVLAGDTLVTSSASDTLVTGPSGDTCVTSSPTGTLVTSSANDSFVPGSANDTYVTSPAGGKKKSRFAGLFQKEKKPVTDNVTNKVQNLVTELKKETMTDYIPMFSQTLSRSRTRSHTATLTNTIGRRYARAESNTTDYTLHNYICPKAKLLRVTQSNNNIAQSDVECLSFSPLTYESEDISLDSGSGRHCPPERSQSENKSRRTSSKSLFKFFSAFRRSTSTVDLRDNDLDIRNSKSRSQPAFVSLGRKSKSYKLSEGTDYTLSTPNITALPDFNDVFPTCVDWGYDEVFNEGVEDVLGTEAMLRDGATSNHTKRNTDPCCYQDSSYERAVEGDRRGSVPTVSISRPTFSLSPTEEVSDQASISSSYSESKSNRKPSSLKSHFIRRARSITKLDKKRSAGSSSFNSKSAGSVQDMSGGWQYVNTSPYLPAEYSPSSSLSSSTLPSYRCATNPVVLTGGEGSSTLKHPPSSGSVLGKLKRSLSLTRLTKKRSRSRMSHTDDEATLSSPVASHRKVQSARSYESLLVAAGRIPSVDLGDGHIQVTPLHRSMLGEGNCIRLTSSAGSCTYYSCRNSEEASQWLNHLRKTVNPGEEQMRRSDVSLKVWVQEAKNCPNKKRYYCEISLDKALYARTSTKPKGEMLFWGEQFDFDNLPSVKSLTVTLHREADKKKRRDKSSQIGYVTIPVAELTSRQLLEKWHTLSPPSLVNSKSSIRDSKTELPQIRLKIRYQTVEILPLACYNPLVKYVKANYQSLVEGLEPMLSVRAKEDIACSLVHILQREQLARRFLCDTVISEVPKHENLNLMLRGNTIATKAIEAYMKLVGNKYLHDTLEDFIRLLLDSEDSCEVDPGRLENNAMLQRNQCNLVSYCEMVWGRIINSHCYFPSELRDVFTSFRRQCEHMKKTEVSDNLISACIFLRFICPAIMSPSLFGLCQELPEDRQSRNFTLVAKTLQSLANFTKFGSKEDYMLFMNDFVEREWNQMQNFLKQISSSDHSYPLTQFEGYIDSGKHLSLLHSLLNENLETEDKREKFADLVPILNDIQEELNSNTGSKNPAEESRSSISSQHSSNLVVPGLPRPESDEYVELSQDKTLDFSSGYQPSHTCRPLPGKQLNVRSAKNIHAGSAGPSLSHYSGSLQRPSLTVGQESSHPLTQTASAQHMGRPKDPDADISNRSDTDTMRSTSSTGSRKVVRHRVWDRVLTANDLVNAKPVSLQPVNKDQPLAFVNPAFKHSTSSMLTSPRHKAGSEAGSSLEFTPLPNKFNSLNLRGRNKKGGEVKREGSSPMTLARYNHRDHTQTLGRSHHIDHAHSLSATNSMDISPRKESFPPLKHAADDLQSPDNSEFHRDEKRYGCAKFPAMELYPETAVRPQPDGSSSSVDSPTSNQLAEMHQSGADRPNTPTSSISWAGSQLSLNSQQTGIRNLQKSIDETSKIKQEYEAEVLVLRQQLLEAQTRLSGTESKLAYQAEQTNEVMEEWKARLDESEERLRAQQHEKDEQIKNIIQRLLAIEEDLRQEQQDMRSAISRKEQIIESQERRIRELDSANSKLQQNLNEMKAKLTSKGAQSNKQADSRSKPTSNFAIDPSDSNKTYKTTLYVADYQKSSFC